MKAGGNRVRLCLLTVLAVPLLAHSDEDIPPDWHACGVLLSPARIATLQSRVAQKAEPTYTAWLKLKQVAEAELQRQPHIPEEWYVPGFYTDAEGHRKAKAGMQDDANSAYVLALCYRVTAEEKFACAAARLITACCTRVKKFSTKDDSRLCFSYHFPAFIFAADLIKAAPSWPKEEQEQFRAFLRKSALPMNTMGASNNWGNWGLLLSISIAAYLDDAPLFRRCLIRWKEFVGMQIAEDGNLKHEVGRNGGRSGVWYSNFSLMPQTLAAEVARVNGVDLFEYKSPSGRCLRQAFEKLAPWCSHPESFPFYKGDPKELHGAEYVSYFEILNARWPNPDAKALLQKCRPMTAAHSAPALTFTHGELLNRE